MYVLHPVKRVNAVPLINISVSRPSIAVLDNHVQRQRYHGAFLVKVTSIDSEGSIHHGQPCRDSRQRLITGDIAW